MDAYQKTIKELLAHAGICVDGTAPYDIHVRDQRFYKRVLSEGSLGLGESYMDGWWECEALDEFFNKLLRAKLHQRIKGNFRMIWQALKAKLFNLQNIKRSKEIVVQHYNIGNKLYEKMLGKHMMYSCGYWDEARDLDDAQEKKLELICQKLKLEAGMRVLDIGCGWGGFAAYAAQHYQVGVVGLTLSENQAILAREHCRGLDVDIRLQDYREIHEPFDRILSIGMMEHVGVKNHQRYMEVVHDNLKDDGISLLHTIGKYTSFEPTDPWIDKYIFPNSLIPSAAQLTRAMEGYFQIEDWHSFGTYYDYTLMAWLDRFKAAWRSLDGSYDQRFYRMWKYYLTCCAGSFRSRENHLWQIVMVKDTFNSEYKAVRSLWEGQY